MNASDASDSVKTFIAYVHRAITLDIDVHGLARDLIRYYEKIDNAPSWRGTLYVFLDTGWQNVLPELRVVTDYDDWQRRNRELKKALVPFLDGRRIRLIMADDMELLIAESPAPKAPLTLARLLCGNAARSLYDVPKVSKFLIQVANPDSPVLLFDWDLLAFGDSPLFPSIEISFGANLKKLLDHVQALKAGGNPKSFVRSGQYLTRKRATQLINRSTIPPAGWELAAYNGSAARTMFLADDPLDPLSPMRIDVVRAFFKSLGAYGLGAPAFGAPISGAGMTMSPALAAEWPPCSHFRQNVMWQDDWFLSSWHAGANRADFGVVEDAVFVKPRVLELSMVTLPAMHFHLADYLPGLVLGTVMSGWATSGAFEDVRQGKAPAQQLWSEALARLNEVVKQWGSAAFAKTYLHSFIHLASPSTFAPSGLADATKRLPETFPTSTLTVAGSPPLEAALRMLVEDCAAYGSFVEYWRELVGEFQDGLGQAHPWRL